MSNTEIFICNICEYETFKVNNWTRHISSKKHCNNIKTQNAHIIHECKRCKYKTSKINHWEKHLNTMKHKHSTEEKKTKRYGCTNCSKSYKYLSGLDNHLKECRINQSSTEKNEFSMEDKLFQKIDSLLEQNTHLQNKLLQIAKEPKIHKQTNNFNIIQYLNNDCKNAMNLSDFLNNLNVTFQNLDIIEKQGYLRGVQDSFVTSLKQLEQNQRPIHCTDHKRKQFYIKDNDQWDKDTNQESIQKAIRELNTLQLQTLYSWQNLNPNWLNEEGKRDKVNQITQQLTSMYSSKAEDMKKKIMTEISNVTLLKKTT